MGRNPSPSSEPWYESGEARDVIPVIPVTPVRLHYSLAALYRSRSSNRPAVSTQLFTSAATWKPVKDIINCFVRKSTSSIAQSRAIPFNTRLTSCKICLQTLEREVDIHPIYETTRTRTLGVTTETMGAGRFDHLITASLVWPVTVWPHAPWFAMNEHN